MKYNIRQTEGDALELFAEGEFLHRVLCFKLLRGGQFIDYFSSLSLIALWAADRDEGYLDEIEKKRVPLILTRSQAFFLAMSSEFGNYMQSQHKGLLEMIADDNPNRRYGLTPDLYGYPIVVEQENREYLLGVNYNIQAFPIIETIDFGEDIQPSFVVEGSK